MSGPQSFVSWLVSALRCAASGRSIEYAPPLTVPSDALLEPRHHQLQPWLRLIQHRSGDIGLPEVLDGDGAEGEHPEPTAWLTALTYEPDAWSWVVIGGLDLAVRLDVDPSTLFPPPPLEVLVSPYDRPRVDLRLASRRWRRVDRVPTGVVWGRPGGDEQLVVHDRLMVRGWDSVPLRPFLQRIELRHVAGGELPLLTSDASWVAHWLLAGSHLLEPTVTPPLSLAHPALLADAVDDEAASDWTDHVGLWGARKLWSALRNVERWARSSEITAPPMPGLGEPDVYRGPTLPPRQELRRALRFQDGLLLRLALIAKRLLVRSAV